MNDWKAPIHPGEILAEELEEIGLKPSELAEKIGLPQATIKQILSGKSNLTADIALRLGKFFNTGPELWLNLQKAYELDVARQNIDETLDKIIPYNSSVKASL